MAIFLLFLFLFSFQGLIAGQDECNPTSCQENFYEPVVRFPFWLKDRQPEYCGYPGFELSCSPTNDTLLELPFSEKRIVTHINYINQLMFLVNPIHFPYLNLSASPFQFSTSTLFEYGLFSCPTEKRDLGQYMNFVTPITGLSSPSHTVYAIQNPSYTYIDEIPLLSCTKMHNYSPLLSWSKPTCGICEAKGQSCRLINNTRKNETECFRIPEPPITGETKSPMVTGETESLVITGVILSLFAAIVAIWFVHRSKNLKKEDIERFLEDYRALKPTRYTYAEIKKITNNFKDKLGQGGYGIVYKGELSNDVHVAAKVLNDSKGNGDDFINEVGTIGKIHHVNVVRLVGYCADGYRRALVYEYLPNDSLQKFISSDQQKRSLGWEKLGDIALGIAKGIEYLHQGCDQRILHFDIKPHNILLDHNFNPKVSDFGLAKLCSKEQSAVSMTAARGTVGYIAPEVFSKNFGNVSCKSDVYSFGMLLLDMVGGRKNKDVTIQNSDEVYFPEWIYNHLNRQDELGIQIEEDGGAKIVKKLTIVGLWCIQWYPGDRPSMKVVIQMLEGDGDTLDMPPNPFATTNAISTGGKMGGRTFTSELEAIFESE